VVFTDWESTMCPRWAEGFFSTGPVGVLTDRAVDVLPSAVNTPFSEVVVDGRPSVGKS
jgi:hypothetical protein